VNQGARAPPAIGTEKNGMELVREEKMTQQNGKKENM